MLSCHGDTESYIIPRADVYFDSVCFRTANLDPRIRLEILQYCRKQQQQKATIPNSSHNLPSLGKIVSIFLF